MSQENNQSAAQGKTQTVLDGPLKHIRAAALAAALVPLASVAATPAEAQTDCSSASICGVVWADINKNGIQDAGEGFIENAVVTLITPSTEDVDPVTSTNSAGEYYFTIPPGEYTILVQIPPSTQASPADQGGDDTLDSDGETDGLGNSVATVSIGEEEKDTTTDFGFSQTPMQQPGTGTPGYWKNHPEAWPVQSIIVGGTIYTKSQALAFLDTPGKDKRLTMFSSLVPAILNVLAGNDSSCVASTITAAHAWMETYGPLGSGSGVHAASLAWKVGEPFHRLMDNYNNGMLCAPHRD